MFKKANLFSPVIILLMVLCAVLTSISLFFDFTLFLISAGVTLIAFAALFIILRRLDKRSGRILAEIGYGIQYTGDGGFMDAPVPVIVIYDRSEIIWYNKLCADSLFGGIDMLGEIISNILPGLDVSIPSPPEGYDVTFRNKRYTSYISTVQRSGAEISVIYFIEDTDLKRYSEEYHLSRPSIAIIMVDNYEEMIQDSKESERAHLMGEIEALVEKFIMNNHGFVMRIERDKYLAIIEERGLVNMIATKFDVLDHVRNIKAGTRITATLSIGIGHKCSTLNEAQTMARQALEMCLGRGGDQVAVKNQNGYEFYGGVSKGIEKRTKVKTRIIAMALSDLIKSSGNVIIMGHRFSDLDCLGSSVGMLKAVKSMDKHVVVCMDKEKNLVKPLLDRLIATKSCTPEDFVSPDEAHNLCNQHTLLIILDTHIPHVLESEELYRACKSVVVIDHHRKLVNYIDNAVIFYHEPFASSASEMVTELIQYFPSCPQLTKLEAEALLSGITLDTKNFILRTGVRTFEAAAYLRRVGADTVEVRKLFSSTMESYQQKSNLVSNAEIYRGCALAFSSYQFDGIKIIAPQAADELMNISGVSASFVMYTHNDIINISARSMGEINVQVIMEKLGGGGHHTMAAAQFQNSSIDDIKERVMRAIDEYLDSLNPTD